MNRLINGASRGLQTIDKEQFTGGELFREHVEVSVAGRADQTPEYNPLRNSGHDRGDFVFVKFTFPAVDPAELTFWNSIRNSADPEVFKNYLTKYPTGLFAGLARQRLAALTGSRTGSSSSTVNRPDRTSKTNAEGDSKGSTYEDLVQLASDAYNRRDYMGAINYAQLAIKLDEQKLTAYQLISLWALKDGDIATAEQAMRAVLEHNGSVAFKVAHTHDAFQGKYCTGSLLVSKKDVSYVDDDGHHSFQVEDSNLKEIKKNNLIGAALGAFGVKPISKVKNADNSEVFIAYFAPLYEDKTITDLIVRLALAY